MPDALYLYTFMQGKRLQIPAGTSLLEGLTLNPKPETRNPKPLNSGTDKCQGIQTYTPAGSP